MEVYPKNTYGEETEQKIETKEMPIWIVTIKIPRKLMTNIERGYADIAGEKLDLEDIEQAENENLEQGVNAPEMEQMETMSPAEEMPV